MPFLARRLPLRIRLSVRTMIVIVGLTAILMVAGLRWFRGSQGAFNVVIGRTVPRGSTLAALEAVAGPAIRPAPADRLTGAIRRKIERDSVLNSDGWREGDFLVYYEFPDDNRWWFQIRDGKLVNYDPAVLMGQSQQGAGASIR
jgi:hypothetical protein